MKYFKFDLQRFKIVAISRKNVICIQIIVNAQKLHILRLYRHFFHFFYYYRMRNCLERIICTNVFFFFLQRILFFFPHLFNSEFEINLVISLSLTINSIEIIFSNFHSLYSFHFHGLFIYYLISSINYLPHFFTFSLVFA